jgi:hypothetical protein
MRSRLQTYWSTRTFILVIPCFIACSGVTAQEWQWVEETGKGPGNSGGDNIGLTHMVADGQGNLLVTGGIRDSMLSDDCNIPGTWVPYLYRFDADGTCLGLRQLYTQGTGICIDANGNHTVVGQGYITKYATNDTVLWTRPLSVGRAIQSDMDNNIIVAGYSSADVIAPGCVVEGDLETNPIFLMKYDEDGNCQWVMQSEHPPTIKAIATDAAGNIIVTGMFTGQTVIGSTSLVSDGMVDMLVAMISPDGQCLWAQRGGGKRASVNYNKDNGLAVAVNPAGDIYLTGSFTDTATFGQIEVIGKAWGNNVFVAHYSAAGNVQWARGFGDRYDNEGFALAVTPYGNLIVGGRFVDYIHLDHVQLTSEGHYDLFAMEMDEEGNVLWALSAGGESWNESISAMVMQGTDLIVSGVFFSSASFGPLEVSGTGTRSYIAKISGITGIGESYGETGSLSLYPNPSTGPLSLSWPSTSAGAYTLIIYDAQGREVHHHSGQTTTGSTTVQLELSHLPSGIYFGRLASGDAVRSFKWVRE